MIQRYARRIADLHDSLERSTEFVGTANSTSNPLDNPLITSRMMIANLLSPHFDLSTDLDDSSAMNRVVDACTAFSAIEIFDGISSSELKIVTAIEHVERSICQTIFLAHRELKIPEVETDITLDRMWQRRAHRALRLVSSLMQHLKWTAWKTCEQKCGTGEVCHTSNWIEDDEQEGESLLIL
ncbi:hypothetical protein DL93DRAFT_2092350 [Clavulina sp. PMI_390]|nr:hypothetical protein DL93DRAFT_2092350 [Clavulina sp. PMI_390]